MPTCPKTRTPDGGYGFSQVRVRVPSEIPKGYPCISLLTIGGLIGIPVNDDII